MTRFYSKYMTRTVREAVEDALAVSPQEQLQLFEELALMRTLAGESIKLYSAAKETGKQPVIDTAAMIMQQQLNEVVRTCEAAARIDASAKDKVSVHTIHHFVDQIVRIAFDSFGDDPKAKEFEHLIRTQLKLPRSGNDGTSLTPDMDVTEMDSSVPKE